MQLSIRGEPGSGGSTIISILRNEGYTVQLINTKIIEKNKDLVETWEVNKTRQAYPNRKEQNNERTNNEKVRVLLNNGNWREAKFKIGDFVHVDDRECVVVGISVYPNIDYVFSYSIFPSHRGSNIPEDELIS